MVNLNIELAELVLNEQIARFETRENVEFWSQCVRDIDGSWAKYSDIVSLEGLKYFHGQQKSLDYTKPKEVEYLWSNLLVREYLYEAFRGIQSGRSFSFEALLKKLHATIAYKPVEPWKLKIRATNTHTSVVINEVMKIAKSLGDPYGKNKVCGPVFVNFPKHANPKDVFGNYEVMHYYPNLEFTDLYLGEVFTTLKYILKGNAKEIDEYLDCVSYIFQLLVNLHYFPTINNSIYMNLANALLDIAGFSGIPHGINDFVAMRLQPSNFSQYFRCRILVSTKSH